MGRKVTIATCTVNQWAMDFEGNYGRILDSIKIAKEKGARYRLGPELEIPGYGASDHFHESDTCLHSWQVLAKLLQDHVCQEIICDVGMPVMYKNVCYNSRVIFLNGMILLVRPKMILCDDFNYRESRWFTAWTKKKTLEDMTLPTLIQAINGQKTVKFGDGVISTPDTRIGIESCEELFVPNSPHVDMTLDGVELIMNASASHHSLRKLGYRYDAITAASSQCGGVYVYSNLIGCDGERLYYDGSSMICLNGEILVAGVRFSLSEVTVNTGTVDLDEVSSYRNSIRSRSNCAASMVQPYPEVTIDFAMSVDNDIAVPTTQPIQVEELTRAEEISLGPACWLWDYLRRSELSGFFLSLSGGIDSASSACLVASMCRLVCHAVALGDATVIGDVRRIVEDDDYLPTDPSELAARLLTTCYMRSENNSDATHARALALAKDIGSYHLTASIDSAVRPFIGLVSALFGVTPRFRVHGGSRREDLALQNVQARVRMVLAYLLAQLSQWARGRRGSLLVLGTVNTNECLRGYLTKYGCSSADINPIGGLSKCDIRLLVDFCRQNFAFRSLDAILDAPPTAELEPRNGDGEVVQKDETDMGMNHEELRQYGKLRKEKLLGPYGMFCRLLHIWTHLSPTVIARKVKDFFTYYSSNRHKMTVVTPSYYIEKYTPEDNRFDHRQFLYNVKWPWQFKQIDQEVDLLEKNNLAGYSNVF